MPSYREADEHSATARGGESLKVQLQQRCDASGVAMAEALEDPFAEDEPILTLELRDGRATRQVRLASPEAIASLLAVPFERFSFVTPYDAIVSYADSCIEALVIASARHGFGLYRWRNLVDASSADASTALPSIMVRKDDGEVSFTLGPPSAVARALLSPSATAPLTLTIDGVRVSTHEAAAHTLETLANSVFFDIDLNFDVTLRLSRVQSPHTFRPLRRGAGRSLADLAFPSIEYDPAPMSLYWYAKDAQGLPLLQFLAFYQVVEYYFSVYHQAEARRRVSNLLKTPGFRPDRDADVGRLLAVLTSNSGLGGDERSMFRATLRECVDAEELHRLLSADSKVAEFFQARSKGLASQRLQMSKTPAELRDDVAARLYEIRCRIVHAKLDSRDDHGDLLLPFSREAEELAYDIALVQHVAQQVLIAASSPLKGP